MPGGCESLDRKELTSAGLCHDIVAFDLPGSGKMAFLTLDTAGVHFGVPLDSQLLLNEQVTVLAREAFT